MRIPFSTMLALLLLAAPVQAEDLILGDKPELVLEIAKTSGDANLEKQENGDPRLAGAIAGVPYQVFFLNCDDAGSHCKDLNFYVGFRDIKPTLDAMNEWNRTHRFGRAYLDSELDAALDFDVNLEDGVTRGNLQSSFGLWVSLLDEFSAYVGFTE